MHNLTVSAGTAVVGEGILLAIYLSKPALLEGSVVKVFSWLSANARFYNFYMGIFDLSDIIYYLSIIVLFLFLSVQVIKKKRWS